MWNIIFDWCFVHGLSIIGLMKKLIQILFGIFLFTFPFSIRYVMYEPASYRFGNFNPWVTGFVYLPEVLLGIVFLLWVIRKFWVQDAKIKLQRLWLWGLLGLFALNAFVVTLIAGDSILGAIFVLRLFEAVVVFWLITDRVLSGRQIITILLLGAIFQILLGYAQFVLNGSVGLGFLGEAVIGPEVLGVAKTNLAEGFKQVRAYGTFLHPNIFAAYLLIVFFLSLRYLKYGYTLFWFALFTWGVYLTGSFGAMLVGITGIGLVFLFSIFEKQSFRKAVVLLILIVLTLGNLWLFKNSYLLESTDSSYQERLTQNLISADLYQEHPFGVGVGNYTLSIEQKRGRKLLPWEFQPVHNAYFLVLNETGWQGLMLLVAMVLLVLFRLWKVGKAVPLMMLIMLAPFDHFLWDSFVGMILIGLVAGFFVEENHSRLAQLQNLFSKGLSSVDEFIARKPEEKELEYKSES